MRLQRIAFHRAVRILSGILPVFILAFVGVAGWNYWAKTRDVKPLEMNRQKTLPEGVALQANDFFYATTKGSEGVPFEIHADVATVDTDETSLLKGVTVTVFSRKGEPDRHIHGDECTHQKADERERIECKTNVSVELDPLTTARTQELQFDRATGLIWSPVPTKIDRPGHMTGTAGQMHYHLDTGLMRLTDQADIALTEGGGLHTGAAVFQLKENWVTVSQGIVLSSASGSIRGGSGRADLAPGTYRPTKVIIEDGASMASTSGRSTFSLDSDWLQGELRSDGTAEHVLARGKKVVAENKPTGEDQSVAGRLEGPEIEAWLNAMGRPDNIEARQAPRFTSAQGTLTAKNTIHIDQLKRSVKTEGASTLKSETSSRETSSIEGRDFFITEGQGFREFTTSSQATLKSADLTTVANNTKARINSATNKITSLEQTGNVTLRNPVRQLSGKAGRLTLTGSDQIVLERDNPEVTEGQRLLKAQKITIHQENKSFEGEGAVTMADTSDRGKKIVIQAGFADGNEEHVKYRENVRVYPQSRAQIDADKLDAYLKEKANRFEFEGHVKSIGDGLEATANHLKFVDEGNDKVTADYTGQVVAVRKDKKGVRLVLKGPALNVKLKSGELESLHATQGVEITQSPNLTGHGDQVDYNAVTGEIILTGSTSAEAEVRRGKEFIKGCKIIMMPNGDHRVEACANRSVPSTIILPK
jgi:LPS export ABC transporter protein LptC